MIVKHVRWGRRPDHPRGWATDRSHQRKLRSYRVETAWYERYAERCGDGSRVPRCLGVRSDDDQVLVVLEDLDASGFPGRGHALGQHDVDACLSWLANFHATFLGEEPDGLWPTGTYWHLATRPDELAALDDVALRDAASRIDERLRSGRFRTLVHGDAKVANFCFADVGDRVAAVDFQYVGGGCGMSDLAYFIGSVYDEDECERLVPGLLDRYFHHLGEALGRVGEPVERAALEHEWRDLFPVAWTDFHRFLKGWSPGHWKLHGYSERIARSVVASL